MKPPKILTKTLYVESARMAELTDITSEIHSMQNAVNGLCAMQSGKGPDLGEKAQKALINSINRFKATLSKARVEVRKAKLTRDVRTIKDVPYVEFALNGSCTNMILQAAFSFSATERDLVRMLLSKQKSHVLLAKKASRILTGAIQDLDESTTRIQENVSSAYDAINGKTSEPKKNVVKINQKAKAAS